MPTVPRHTSRKVPSAALRCAALRKRPADAGPRSTPNWRHVVVVPAVKHIPFLSVKREGRVGHYQTPARHPWRRIFHATSTRKEQIRRRRLVVKKGSVSFIPSAEEKAPQDILGPLKHLRSTNPRSTEVEKFSHSGRGVEGAIGGSSLNGTLAIKPPHAKDHQR